MHVLFVRIMNVIDNGSDDVMILLHIMESYNTRYSVSAACEKTSAHLN